MSEELENVIECPYCGAQYLPGEIFYPKDYLGQPYDVDKDINGEILWENGIKQVSNEEYTCDFCKKTFKVNVKHEYTTEKVPEKNFDEDFIIPLYDDRITLGEE